MEDKNSVFWQKYGDNVLIIFPFFENVIVKAEGLHLTDANNNKILDFSSGGASCILGYNHPKFTERLKKQLDEIMHVICSYQSKSLFQAAHKLSEILPGNLDRVAFFSTGTEACEVAIKMAKTFTGKYDLLGFEDGYVGSSFLMTQVSSPAFGSKPVIPGIYKMLTPNCLKCPVKKAYPRCNFFCIEFSERRLGKRLRKIAAMIAEPILPKAGMLVPPPGYFEALKRMLEKYDILLIMDEAKTCFGKIGKWFAAEYHSIVPDILACGKNCGNGYPVSIVATNAKIEERLISSGLRHNSAHMNDPLGAEAVSALIDIIREEDLIENAKTRGGYLFKMLNDMRRSFPQVIKNIHGIGLMACIEIMDVNGERAEEAGLRLSYACEENGLHFMWFSPKFLMFELPVTVTNQDIENGIGIFRKSVEEILNDSSRGGSLVRKRQYERLNLYEKNLRIEKSFIERVIKKIMFK